jgi:hypothetical protein
MPTETAFVVAGIAFAFALFAVVLAWTDFQTTRYRRTHRGPAE